MDNIEKVSILRTVIRHEGHTIPCLAVVIEQMPSNENDIIQIGDDIRAAVMSYKRK